MFLIIIIIIIIMHFAMQMAVAKCVMRVIIFYVRCKYR